MSIHQTATQTRTDSPPKPARAPELEIPTAEEVFDKPYPPAPPLPPAWEGESLAVEFADRECARLIANQLFDPPIHEQEIDKYSRRFGIDRREAETEIRRQRHGN